MTGTDLSTGEVESVPFDAKEYVKDIVDVVAKAVIAELPLSSLAIDERVQRNLDHNRAKRMADGYNPSALGVLAVSLRDDDTKIVIDGMHRTEMLRMLPATRRGGEDPLVTCETWVGLTLAQEAKIFVLRNATQQVPALALFQVRVNGQEPRATEIRDMLSRHGWKAVLGQGAGILNAIKTVEICFNRNAWATEQAFRVISLAWPDKPTKAAEARIITGMTRCFEKHQGKINVERLVAKLTAISPDRVLTEGTYHAQMTGGLTAAQGVGWRIMAEYNKGAGANLSQQV